MGTFDEKMKIVLIILSFLVASLLNAELRVVGIKVTQDGQATKVSIYSEQKEEQKREISVSEALDVIKSIKGSGSTVLIGMKNEKVSLASYLPLLDAISENVWTELEFVDSGSPDFLKTNIQKLIEP
jgi:hypothetical protein